MEVPPMKATLRKMGNSQGVLIPKALVEMLGIEDALDLTVEHGALVLRKPVPVELRQDVQDAQRFRKLCALLQQAYDGEAVELDGLTVYCSMKSGWRNERTVGAELIWKDERDEPLDLASALDRIPD
jgi:antitoxin component of MazEF toxin-antitoxin module